jgi:hypothetical protein
VQTPDAQDANAVRKNVGATVAECCVRVREAREPSAPGSQPTSEGWRLEPEAMRR